MNEKLLETNLSVASLGEVLEILWKNVLVKPENRLAGKTLDGFNLEALDVIDNELQLFIRAGLYGTDIMSNVQAKGLIQSELKRTYPI